MEDTNNIVNNKASWVRLFKFTLIKIIHSFIAVFLLLLCLLVTIVSISVLLLLDLEPSKFFVNIQFYFMIFYSIFLFIFILMNTIKIFGTQFEDSSFLLLLTKPYSRKIIILTQYLSIFTISFIFILVNIWALLLISGIFGGIMKVEYLPFLIVTIMKLFAFLVLYSILVTVGVVSLLSFTPSQITFLVFIIFCSLFLLGGLPYSLMKIETDNTNISFESGGSLAVKKIKETILFDKYLKIGLIKYPALTTSIYNFYNKLDQSELENIDSNAMIKARNDLYQSFGLEEPPNTVVKNITVVPTYWANDEINKYTNKTLQIKITFTNYFISLAKLQDTVNDNDVKKDLLNVILDYSKQFAMANFMILQKNKAPALLTYNQNIANTNIKIDGGSEEEIKPELLNNIFLREGNYKFSGRQRNQYNNIFYNPVYFVLRSVEDYIYNQAVAHYKIVNSAIVRDVNFLKLQDSMNFYNILNTLNFIEQWNQIWTTMMGYYGQFWFEPLASSSIDFAIQQNSLFSYADFKITLVNKKIETNNLQYFQRSWIVLVVYMGLIIILFFFSYYMFMKKNIS